MKKFIVIGALLIGSLMFLPLLFFGTKASETVGTSTINGVTVPNRTRVSAVTPGALQQAFITKMSAYAPLCKSYGIYPSVMMAQAILESQWGMSDLAVQANNIFWCKGFRWVAWSNIKYDDNRRIWRSESASNGIVEEIRECK